MALRDFDSLAYIPLLSVRPGEMRALEELPDSTKDRMLPYVPLRPWVGSNRLQNALDRLEEAYGERPIIVGVGDREPTQQRPVFGELDRLRRADGGFASWCGFIEDHENFIPVAQLSPNTVEESAQIDCLWGFDRGLVIHLPRPAFPGMGALAQRVGNLTDGGDDVVFILDFQTVAADHLQVAALAQGYIATIRNGCPDAFICLSATSFPSSFDNLPAQQIYERRLFNQLTALGIPELIYSDRGSARIERPGGGGGQPYPRIDYPLAADWRFFRHETQSGFSGYQAQARLLAATQFWNPNIRVWGTQMIERTIAGDRSAISSPQKATAARINLHLQVQTFHDDPALAEETEDDWDE
ncbi:hypothetical protein A6F68_02013 [Tsuneonella dongtanensis]|uniref:Beta protein n=1 Tax=Tsuneonella dongtanensis TaxID=692370 RepID=A0A1B2AEJ0_9SPHN|nr:beta family protein [Tsuneonella dongtanensis]ANY20521.1 hypothetical protein A6F68_02013 [Tsuneonella dongtanensis]